MLRADFSRRIAEIAGPPELTGMNVAIIIFVDGSRVQAQTWTITEGAETFEYIQTHCQPNSVPAMARYDDVTKVLDYSQQS